MPLYPPPPAELIVPSEVSVLRAVSLTLLPAEFMDGTLAREMVAAPGPERVIVPVQWSIFASLNLVAYNLSQSFRCRFFGDATELLPVGVGLVTITGTSNIFNGNVAPNTAFTNSLFDVRNTRVVLRPLQNITGGSPLDRVFVTMHYVIARFGN